MPDLARQRRCFPFLCFSSAWPSGSLLRSSFALPAPGGPYHPIPSPTPCEPALSQAGAERSFAFLCLCLPIGPFPCCAGAPPGPAVRCPACAASCCSDQFIAIAVRAIALPRLCHSFPRPAAAVLIKPPLCRRPSILRGPGFAQATQSSSVLILRRSPARPAPAVPLRLVAGLRLRPCAPCFYLRVRFVPRRSAAIPPLTSPSFAFLRSASTDLCQTMLCRRCAHEAVLSTAFALYFIS